MIEPILKDVLRRQSRDIAKQRSEARSLESGPLTAERLSNYVDGLGAGPTTAGPRVNETSALSIVGVLACIRIIAETVASLPLNVYERLDNGKQKAPNHPLYELLHTRPNPEMSSMLFREMLQAHLLVWNSAFAEIEYNQAGTVIGLWPLLPDRMQVQRVNGERVYVYRLPDGTQKALSADRVFHVQGWTSDGLNSYRPIQLARNSLGLAVATEEFGARFFSNGATASGIASHPKTLTPIASDNLRRSLNEQHQGLSRSHRIMILEEGMTWTQLSIPNNHAQFLETRKFQLLDIARMFRVPPHLLADLERATFSNIEHQSIEFVQNTIRPWLVRWEQTINWDLFGSRDRRKFFAEHNVDGLLRGDIASRYQAYQIGRTSGWLCADDIREMENMNPLPDGQGKVFLVQGAMVPIDQAGKQQQPNAPQDEPAPDVAPDRSAYAGLFRDVGHRMLNRELSGLRKAAKQGEAGWSQAVEGVYRDVHEQFTKALVPVFDALLSFGPPEARALVRTSKALAEELAGKELSEGRSALDAAGFACAESLLTGWETSRADAFALRGADFIASLLETKNTLRVA